MVVKKDDRRVKYTKIVIKQSLLEIMKSHPINSITVTDICKLAEINRGTFYTYYRDPYDLLSQIEKELFDEINRSIEKSLNAGRISELLLDIFESIVENGDLCKILFSEYGDKEFLKRIIYIAHDRSIAEWRTAAKEVDKDTLELLYSFTANGSIGIVQNWLENGMKQSPREIASFLDKLSNKGLEAFLAKK